MRILFISEVQWRSQTSRKHLLVRALPDDWSVIFLSPINTRAGENSFLLRRDERRPRVAYRSIPHAKPDSTIPAVRALTPVLSLWGGARIAAAARAFAPDVAILSLIWAAPSIGDLHELAVPVVYDCNDLHFRFYPSRPDEARRRFEETVRDADEVVSSSEYLAEVCGRGLVIGNGVDLDTFSGSRDLPLPDPIARSPLSRCRDLVCYVGSVDDRIDFHILEAVVEGLERREAPSGLVCVGRVFDSARADRERLEQRHREHVLFTGRVPYEELPSYLSRTKVGVAPFVRNEKTRAINPNKLYMYAAMEQGIVSTPFSKEIARYEPLVRLAAEPTAFASAVEEALGDDDSRRAVREKIAVPNSWSARGSEYVRLLTRIADGGYSP